MRILFTGVRGFIGSALALRRMLRGMRLSALISPHQAGHLPGGGSDRGRHHPASAMAGSVRDGLSRRPLCRHTPPRQDHRGADPLNRCELRGTRLMLATAAASGLERFVQFVRAPRSKGNPRIPVIGGRSA